MREDPVEVYRLDLTLSLRGAYSPVTLGWRGCKYNGISYAP